MLARENRLIKPEDFRSTMKLGRKVSAASVVLYLKRVEDQPQARFGFVVAKTVGNAVVRNRVKRRLRELARANLVESSGMDVVVRPLPAAADYDWNTLQTDFQQAMQQGLAKVGK
ncbi:MAG: ribonuclease P protein component [Micrococcales bacterium]